MSCSSCALLPKICVFLLSHAFPEHSQDITQITYPAVFCDIPIAAELFPQHVYAIKRWSTGICHIKRAVKRKRCLSHLSHLSQMSSFIKRGGDRSAIMNI